MNNIARKTKQKLRTYFKGNGNLDRFEKIRHNCKMSGLGLEIGAGYSPAAPKADGYNVEILDHASTEGLREKYANDPSVDIDKFEEVDYIWNGEPYEELISKSNCYDYVIASHVIEHTPNLVFFLKEIENLLKPGGVLSLAIPLKHRCFDYLRPLSTTGQVLQAHIENRTKHSPGVLFDNVSASISMNGVTAWGEEVVENLKFYHENNLQFAGNRLKEGQDTDVYIDAHAWCFTASSFLLIINDLAELGYIDLAVCGIFDPEGCEFIVALEKGGKREPADRLALSIAAANGE